MGPPSLSELTLMIINTGLTHLGSEASISDNIVKVGLKNAIHILTIAYKLTIMFYIRTLSNSILNLEFENLIYQNHFEGKYLKKKEYIKTN